MLVQREPVQQKSNPGATSADAATEKKSRPLDLVPEENKTQAAGAPAAPAGGSAVQKKDEGTPAPAEKADDKKEAPVDQKAASPEDEAAKKKEEERQAAVKAEWEGLLGKWLGGPLAKLVLEEVSVAKLNGYVQDGLKQAGPAIGNALKGAAKPEAAQEQGLKDFSNALAGVMTGLVDSWVKSESGQKVLTKISHWVQENPGWVMGIVGTALIGGAIAAWFANPDVKFDVPLGLPKGWEMKAGIDLGKLQSMGFQGASLVVANKNQAIKLAASVSNKDEKNDAGEVTKTEKGGKLAINVGKEDAQHASFVMNGTITETKDGLVAHTLGGALELVDPKTGAKVTINKDGKWDSKGNKEDAFSYSAQAGTDVTGSFSCNLKDAVVVDDKGNIHTLSSQSFKVAVGEKAGKFKASVGQKTETKDGVSTTTTEIGASAKGQLGAGTMFEADGNVSIGADKVVVKLNGKMETKIGGKTVTLDGSYQTDGEVTGKVRLGEGGQYTEIKGTKKGDVITFSTTEVFKGGSLETKTTQDQKTGVTGQQTTANIKEGATNLTMSAGTEGNKVGVDTKVGDHTSLNANAGTDAQGQFQGGVGMKYDSDTLKFFLDAEMKKGQGSLNVGTSINTKEGFKLDANLKVDDTRMTELAIKLGYKDPAAFRTFLVGYKRSWSQDNQQYADHFDALLEYSLGKWQARVSGGLDLMGGKLQKTNLDLGGAYKLNDQWKLIGGMQMNGAMNQDNNRMQQSFRPYVGAQFGNVAVTGYYDTGTKSAGIGLTIPF